MIANYNDTVLCSVGSVRWPGLERPYLLPVRYLQGQQPVVLPVHLRLARGLSGVSPSYKLYDAKRVNLNP
jgi:hypothetical protein